MNEIEDDADEIVEEQILNIDGVRLMCLQMSLEYYAHSEGCDPSYLVNAAEIFRQYLQPPEERVTH